MSGLLARRLLSALLALMLVSPLAATAQPQAPKGGLFTLLKKWGKESYGHTFDTIAGSSNAFGASWFYATFLGKVVAYNLLTGEERSLDIPGGSYLCTNNPTRAYLEGLAPRQIAVGGDWVVVAPHFSKPIVASADLSSVRFVDQVGVVQYSYWVDTDGVNVYLLSSSGLYAFTPSGSLLWRIGNVTSGAFSISGGYLLVATGKSLVIVDRSRGLVAATLSYPAISASGSYVGTSDGRVLRYDGSVAQVASVGSPVRSIAALPNGALVLATGGGLLLLNGSRVVSRIDGDFRVVAAAGYVVAAGSSGGALVATVKGGAFSSSFWLPTRWAVNWVSLHQSGAFLGVTYLLVRSELYSVSLPEPESGEPHVKIEGKWSLQGLSVTVPDDGHTVPVVLDPDPSREPNMYIADLTVRVRQVVATNAPVSVIRSQNVQPWYFDLQTWKQYVTGPALAAEMRGFWNLEQIQVTSGGLRMRVRWSADATWYPVLESRSLPASTGAIYWMDTLPLNLSAYDSLRIAASVLRPTPARLTGDWGSDVVVAAQQVLTAFIGGYLARGVEPVADFRAVAPVRAVVNFVKEAFSTGEDLSWMAAPLIASEAYRVGSQIVASSGSDLITRLHAAVSSTVQVADKEESLRRVTGAVTSAMKETASQAYLNEMEKKLLISRGDLPGVVAELLVDAYNSVPESGFNVSGYVFTKADAVRVLDRVSAAVGGGDAAYKLADRVYRALEAEGLAKGGKVTFYDVRENVGLVLQAAVYEYLREERGLSAERAGAAATALRVAMMEHATVNFIKRRLPGEMRVDQSSFKTALAKNLAASFSLPGDKALDLVNQALAGGDVQVVVKDVDANTLSVSYEVRDEYPFASAALSFAQVLADVIGATLGTYAGIAVIGASIGVGLGVYGIPAMANVYNDITLGASRQGMQTSVGVAFLGYAGGSRVLVVYADIPDVSVGFPPSVNLGALQSFDNVRGFVEQGMRSYAGSMGLQDVRLRYYLPVDWLGALQQEGVTRVERIGLFVLFTAWRQPPYIGSNPTKLRYSGELDVENLAVTAVRKRAASVGQGELAALLQELRLNTAGASLKPTVSGSSAVFTISTSVEFVPAVAVSLEFGKGWGGYTATLDLEATVWVVQHFENVSGNLVARADFHHRGAVAISKVKLVALPNRDPVRVEVKAPLPDRWWTVEVGMDKFTLIPRIDGKRDYEVKPGFERYFDPGNGGVLQNGEKRIYVVVYNAAAGLGADTSVQVWLNGTGKIATLPSVATVEVVSPCNQTVKLKVTYSVALENGSRFITLSEGTLADRSLSLGKQTVRLNFDVSSLVASLVSAVGGSGLPGVLTVRADVQPQNDTDPSNNWDKAQFVLYPEQLRRIARGNATLQVTVLDVRRSPVAGAEVKVTGGVNLTGATDSSGLAVFRDVPAGAYNVCASAQGFSPACRHVIVNGSTSLELVLVPLNLTSVPIGAPAWGNATAPPLQYPNGSTLVPLQVKVVYRDGYPVAGAEVYVNGTLEGYTDSWGTWTKYYRAGSVVSVKVSVPRLGYTETRTARLSSGALLIFTLGSTSGVAYPEVGVLFVDVFYTRGLTPAVYGIVFQVFSTVPQNVTVRAGLITPNGTVLASGTAQLSFRDRGVIRDIVFVSIDKNLSAVAAPFANITSFQSDTEPRNNMLIGAQRSFKPRVVATVAVLVDYYYGRRGGVLYPGETGLGITVILTLSRAVDFKAEVNSTLPVVLNLTWHLPGSQPSVSVRRREVVSGKQGVNTVMVVNFTLPRARVLNITAQIPYIADLDMEQTGTTATVTVSVPPHFIVESYTVETPSVRPGDRVSVVVRAWSNVYDSELPAFTPVITIGGVSVSGLEPIPFKAGSNDYRVTTLSPNIQLAAWEPVRTVDMSMLCLATPDAVPGDNEVRASLALINTQSWVFWVMVVIGVLLLLAVVFAVLRALFTVRVTVYSSPYIEALRL